MTEISVCIITAVHLRNGQDWENACTYAVNTTSFMSSHQCTGYSGKTMLTKDMCIPDTSHVIK